MSYDFINSQKTNDEFFQFKYQKLYMYNWILITDPKKKQEEKKICPKKMFNHENKS